MPSPATHPSVVCTVLDDGGVLLHLDTKFYYSLNRTGMAVWLCLEDRAGDPGRLIAERFPGTDGLDREIDDFLGDLRREKLIDLGDDSTAAAAPPSPDALPAAIAALAAWEKPILTRHAVPLSQILSNPFNPCIPLAE